MSSNETLTWDELQLNTPVVFIVHVQTFQPEWLVVVVGGGHR